MSKQADGPRLSYESSGVRQIRPTALGRGTHGVPDVRRMVESQFHVAFPHRVWVAGQVALPLGDDGGTLRFSLAATTDEPFVLACAVPAESLRAVRDLLSRTHDAALEDVVREGRLARVGGLLRYDALRNGVVFVVSELDPTPTAAELADARLVVLGQVREAGLAERQRRLAAARAPLEVAVVGGQSDPSLGAAEEELVRSGYAVRVRLLPVPVSGVDAGQQVARAVQTAAQDSDVVLVVREQGRLLGLASYDALEAAQAVADAPVPVVAGLGGGDIGTAVDEVAHLSVPTARDAARWVVDRLARAERSLEELAGAVADESAAAAQRCCEALEQARVQVEDAGEQAVGRAEQSRARARLRLRVACAVLAVLAVVAAAVVREPLLLLLLLVPLAVQAGAELWWSRGGTRGDKRMGQRDDEFVQVVQRLTEVRDELTTTSSPERVAALREQAAALVARGREILRRTLPGTAAGTAAGTEADGPAAAGAPAARPAEGADGAGVPAGAGDTGPAAGGPAEGPAAAGVGAPVAAAAGAGGRPLADDEAVALVDSGASGGYVPPGEPAADAGWVQPDAAPVQASGPTDGGSDPTDGSGSTRVRSSS